MSRKTGVVSTVAAMVGAFARRQFVQKWGPIPKRFDEKKLDKATVERRHEIAVDVVEQAEARREKRRGRPQGMCDNAPTPRNLGGTRNGICGTGETLVVTAYRERNEPCPCGSGKKNKRCHNAGNAYRTVKPAAPSAASVSSNAA